MKISMNETLLVSLVFCVLIEWAHSLFSNSLKKLKEKAKNAYKKKFGKGKTWHFLGFDLTEYPGTNQNYRQLNQDKWEEYYKCLQAQDSNLGNGFSVTPEAIQSFESSSIILECNLCISPDESLKIDSVEWDFALPQAKKLEPVEYTEHILLSPEDRQLKIFDLTKEHTGQYMCRIGDAQGAPFFLTVVSPPDEDIREVHPEDAGLAPYPLKPERIGATNLILDTEWGRWTPCNKCNKIGRRHRMGYCIVIYGKDMAQLPQNAAETTDPSTDAIDIQRTDYDLLRIFKFGIPCHSHILPHSIRTLKQVSERKMEVMVGFCKVQCAENKIFEVRDKDGNVIEKANNSAGIYSMAQGVPAADPPVERRLEYAEKGKKVVLTCPGHLNDDTPVEWQIGSKKIVPDLLIQESQGRVYVSITDKIHIKKAHISDSNIYSCWQHNELAGTIRLIVEKQYTLDFNHHIMLFGMVVVWLVFLRVFLRVCFGRKVVQASMK